MADIRHEKLQEYVSMSTKRGTNINNAMENGISIDTGGTRSVAESVTGIENSNINSSVRMDDAIKMESDNEYNELVSKLTVTMFYDMTYYCVHCARKKQ